MSFNFNDFVVFEMANNHQGSVEHGKKIIESMGKVAKEHSLSASVKLQYRNLETFIHPEFVKREDVKHIPRFTSTKLSDDQFKDLGKSIKDNGLKLVITPFDEVSVDKCIDHGVDILKVASCSANDWPLLEKIASAGKPVIASTGGLSIEEIDNLVYFLKHKNVDFALMHCVAIYPTPNERLNLDFITKLRKRYPGLTIGYSGHEAPDNVLPGQIAIAKGAQMLERHVGIPTDTITLNKYSMNPQEVVNWLNAVNAARAVSGLTENKDVTESEFDSLQTLKRGVFAKRPIKEGETVTSDDVFFAMPVQTGQLVSGDFGRYRAKVVASKSYETNQPLYEEVEMDNSLVVRSIIHDYLGLLNEAGIEIGNECTMELSHHYGIERFREVGALIINFVNREYCKKFVLMLPGQKHPYHFHKLKEETFQVLSGDLSVSLDDERRSLKPGDQVLVKRNVWHSFSSKEGCVFEEISTTHHKGDSYYKDESIAKLDLMQRKTFIEEW